MSRARAGILAILAVLAILALLPGCSRREKLRYTPRSEEREERQEQAEQQAERMQISASEVDPEHANKGPVDAVAARQALLSAYPDCISAISGNSIVMANGERIPFDDGKAKDWQTLLDEGDAEDMFFIPYSSRRGTPLYLNDAGRSRCEALFRAMYGNSVAAVRRNCETVDWFGQKVLFASPNGAADSLRAVAREIKGHPELMKYVKSSGTLYWRPVRGAKRMSAHSYAIAFDIAVAYSDYWQWNAGTNKELARVQYKNRFPRKLVDIFERHGFIWGGAWYHYDTMHFEFRPELLRYAAAVGA